MKLQKNQITFNTATNTVKLQIYQSKIQKRTGNKKADKFPKLDQNMALVFNINTNKYKRNKLNT